VALKRWSKELGNILIVLVVLSEGNPGESFKTLGVRCAHILFPLSVVLFKYFPGFGRAFSMAGSPMVTGVTNQKNSLGMICCVFGFVLVWDLVDARKQHGSTATRAQLLPQWISLAIGLWLLVVSESKTSLVAFLLGLAIFFSTYLPIIRRSRALFAKFCIIAVSVGLVVAAVWTTAIAPLLHTMDRDATFTERTKIWQSVLDQHTDPIIGSGFYGFWLDKGEGVVEAFHGTILKSAHDGYLEMYLDGGIIGCALLLFFLLGTCWRLANAFSHDSAYSRLLFSFAMMCLAMNFSETYFFRLGTIWFALELGALARRAVPSQTHAAEQPLVQGGAGDMTFAGERV
jgi:O-antigen ligase